jgi:hypothetical protein
MQISGNQLDEIFCKRLLSNQLLMPPEIEILKECVFRQKTRQEKTGKNIRIGLGCEKEEVLTVTVTRSGKFQDGLV